MGRKSARHRTEIMKRNEAPRCGDEAATGAFVRPTANRINDNEKSTPSAIRPSRAF